MSPPPYIIVWDLDRTLGEFSALEGAEDGEPVTVRLRPGLDEALERLSAAGFAHVVLTLATPSYAELALQGTGLRARFVEVAGAGQRRKGDARGIAETHGLLEGEIPDRMIFVGDHPWNDAPTDHRVVFHIEPFALRRPAEPLAALILELLRRGEGSLRRGFDALVSAAPPGVLSGTVRHDLPGVGQVLLAPRVDDCPVIIFAEEPAAGGQGTPVTFTCRSPVQVT
jgi:hypothetical protein